VKKRREGVNITEEETSIDDEVMNGGLNKHSKGNHRGVHCQRSGIRERDNRRGRRSGCRDRKSGSAY